METSEAFRSDAPVVECSSALAHLPHRLLSLGVTRRELRHYGTPEEHDAAHGLDARSLRQRRTAFVL